MGPPEAEVIPFWNRRRNATIAVLAAALAALAFGIGYLTRAHARATRGSPQGDGRDARHAAAPAGAHGSIQLGSKDDAGNWPMLVRVSNLGEAQERRLLHALADEKGRRSRRVARSSSAAATHPTEVEFTVAYKRKTSTAGS